MRFIRHFLSLAIIAGSLMGSEQHPRRTTRPGLPSPLLSPTTMAAAASGAGTPASSKGTSNSGRESPRPLVEEMGVTASARFVDAQRPAAAPAASTDPDISSRIRTVTRASPDRPLPSTSIQRSPESAFRRSARRPQPRAVLPSVVAESPLYRSPSRQLTAALARLGAAASMATHTGTDSSTTRGKPSLREQAVDRVLTETPSHTSGSGAAASAGDDTQRRVILRPYVVPKSTTDLMKKYYLKLITILARLARDQIDAEPAAMDAHTRAHLISTRIQSWLMITRDDSAIALIQRRTRLTSTAYGRETPTETKRANAALRAYILSDAEKIPQEFADFILSPWGKRAASGAGLITIDEDLMATHDDYRKTLSHTNWSKIVQDSLTERGIPMPFLTLPTHITPQWVASEKNAWEIALVNFSADIMCLAPYTSQIVIEEAFLRHLARHCIQIVISRPDAQPQFYYFPICLFLRSDLNIQDQLKQMARKSSQGASLIFTSREGAVEPIEAHHIGQTPLSSIVFLPFSMHRDSLISLHPFESGGQDSLINTRERGIFSLTRANALRAFGEMLAARAHREGAASAELTPPRAKRVIQTRARSAMAMALRSKSRASSAAAEAVEPHDG